MSSSEALESLPVDALSELARSASEDLLPQVLQTVADTIRKAAGYQSITLNIFRPQWDEYEVVFVNGSVAAADTLMGTTISRTAMDELLSLADVNREQVYLFKEGNTAPESYTTVWWPDLPKPQSDRCWHAGDALLTVLTGADGQPLGFVSADEPVSGLRPTEAELRLLQLIGRFAEQAVRAAQRAAAAEAESALQAQLTVLSPAISSCRTASQLDDLLLDTLTRHFGFQRVTFYRRTGDSLVLERSSGWQDIKPPALLRSSPDLGRLLDGDPSGSAVVPATALFGEGSAAVRSGYNGRGPLAWHDHCVVLAWHDDPEAVRVVVLQDPEDRLLPTVDRQQSLQLLIDLAASVARGIAQRLQLDRLASYDTLTGVRNRRGLGAAIADRSHIALLVCDLDNFKHVNDRYGHYRGDQVLAAFGELLRDCARAGDIPARLGGEEFCVVLPDTTPDGALALAERIRTETQTRLTELVPEGVTVSIGIAIGVHDGLAAGNLLSVADAALYEAKQRGRNRVVLASEAARV